MGSVCDLCGSKVTEEVNYFKNMSLYGKIFRYIPSYFGKLIPLESLKHRFLHGKKMISVFDDHSWHFCEDCNFSYVYPKLSIQSLNEYYSADYWSIRAPSELKEHINSAENTDRPKSQLKFLNKHNLTSVRSMLDFGAGLCGAPKVFKEQGFCNDVTILDPSSQAKIVADILEVKQEGNFDDVGQSQFDLLYSSHSLEHVSDIKEVLQGFSKAVKHGGHAFIEVPNIANRSVLEMAHHAPHTFNFSKESLCKAMSIAGFELVASDTVGISVGERLQNQDKDLDVLSDLRVLFEKRAS